MGEMIRVRHLKKYFDTPAGKLHAVDDVNFTINEGETLGVVGESGCGKSTLGRVLIRLLDPTDGEVLYKGQDISKSTRKESRDLRRDMQIIFQDPFSSLNPRMTVSQLIGDPLKAYRIYKTKNERTERTLELMDTVGLARRFADSYPHELDGGRRQRIGIARALSLNPRFIVCDEPVSALDVSIQAQVLNLLQDLQEAQGLTYMFITHDLSVVKHISNDILVMYTGTMVEKCSSDDLFELPLHPYTKGLLSAIPIPSLEQKRTRVVMRGEISSPIEPKPGCRFMPRCPYATEICRTQFPQYEEILPNHFVSCHNVREINKL
ncbi:MAG: ATP-binding cassette domain-containing protein [Oscillospiraceae bacterium]|nr:ATP-binding cassette domain-containing protein [Oscillospiraceae bacterium]